MSKNEISWLPNKVALKKDYDSYVPHLNVLIMRIEEFLRSAVKINSAPTYKYRVKSFKSYYAKLLKYPPKSEVEDIPVLSDIIGMRIICAFLQDLKDVEAILHNNFTILEIERKGANLEFKEFGYESIHVLLEIPKEFKVGLVLPKKLIFEIQLRTILQDAWAEVEHELIYKAEFSPSDLHLRRKLASINASLSLADIIFQEIRDYQNKLNIELDKRRECFYNLADAHTADVLPNEKNTNLQEESANKNDDIGIKPLETIDDLLLQALEAHNNNNFEKAEKTYSKIIAQNPNEIILSVIYKHRGMAYFAQGNYESACNDFMKSCKSNPANFRSYYYVGIALTLLHKDEQAIEYFSESLNINKFQAHVYFRRALSYFRLNMYTEALEDLDVACSLGLCEEDAKKLRIAIAKKIDIV